MAQGPIDYTSGFGQVSPFTNIMKGLEAGAQFAGIEQQQQARALQLQQAQRAQEQQRAAGVAFNALMENPNPTYNDYLRVSMLLPKEQSESLMKGFEAQNRSQQQTTLSRAAQVMSAFRSNAPEVGNRLLTEWRDAEVNSGRADQGRAIDTIIEVARQDPRNVTAMIGSIMAPLPGAKELIENLGKVQMAEPQLRQAVAAADEAEANAKSAGVTAEFARPVAVAGLSKAQSDAVSAAAQAQVAPALAQLGVQKSQAEIRNLQSLISDRAARLRLDEQRLVTDTARAIAEIEQKRADIPEFARKDINAAAVASGSAQQLASRLNSMADQLSSLNAWSGALGSAGEFWKKTMGTQNAPTLMRQEYVRMRNSLVSKSLPPGSASDQDIALQMEGFLPPNASPQATASFLRGMAKVHAIEAEIETARGDWLANNRGSLGRAAQPFQAGRFRTVPGETFAGFTDRVVKELARPQEGSTGRAIEQIPGVRAPAPGAPAQPVAGAAPSVRSVDDLVRQYMQPPR